MNRYFLYSGLVLLLLPLRISSVKVEESPIPLSIAQKDLREDAKSLNLTTEGIEEFLPKTRVPDPKMTMSLATFGELIGSWTWGELGIPDTEFAGAGLTFDGTYLFLINQNNRNIYVVDPTFTPPLVVDSCSPPDTGIGPWGAFHVPTNPSPLGYTHITDFLDTDIRRLSGEYNNPGWCDTVCTVPAVGIWFADGTENLVMGDTFYLVEVGGENGIKEYVIDPTGCIVSTGKSITHPVWSNISQRALTYNPDDSTFVVGGWNVDKLWEIKWDGTPLPGREISIPEISGFAYDNVNIFDGCPVLWVQTNSEETRLYKYAFCTLPQDEIFLDRIKKPDFFLQSSGMDLAVQIQASNRGTDAQDFDLWVLITRKATGDTVYGDTLMGLRLERVETDTFNFPIWAGGPLVGEEYLIESCLINPGDGDTTNNCSSISVKGSPPCDPTFYDDGTISNAYYNPSTRFILASRFDGVCSPLRLVWAAVNTISRGDPFFPWPDATYDTVEISAWEATPGGSPLPGGELSNFRKVPTDDPSWVVWEPDTMEVISTTGSIAVGMRNVQLSGYEGIATDPARGNLVNFYYDSVAGEWYSFNSLGDWHIRACFECLTGVETEKRNTEKIRTIRLFQNRPNPFTTSTLIRFQIPLPPFAKGGLESGHFQSYKEVSLTVYDITGRLVETLVNKIQEPGIYQFPITNLQLPGSGVYFYRLNVGANGDSPLFTQTRKMILLR